MTSVAASSDYNLLFLPEDRSIEQGSTYLFPRIFYLGDVTATATPIGQVRRTYVAEAPSEMAYADIQFQPLTFQTETIPDNCGNDTEPADYTIIEPFLEPFQTLQIPYTPPPRHETTLLVPGKNSWVYQIRLDFDTGAKVTLARGLVQVKGGAIA